MDALFIPVSAPSGAGEMIRALALATSMRQRNPALAIEFILNEHSPFTKLVPFPATLLPRSATFHPKEVGELIEQRRPSLVVFDNAGRTSQLRAARAIGARVVYISSRPRQRRKAFRLKWMSLLDEHWIAWPEFMAGPLTAVERLKLRVNGRTPRIRYFDAMIPEPTPEECLVVASRFGVAPGEFTLVVPGGGTPHPGIADGPATMGRAAAQLAGQGHPTLLVGTTGAPEHPLLHNAPALPLCDLAALMARARLVVANGGDTLLQALSFQRLCVAAPMAQDQIGRIRSCVDLGIATGVELEAGKIAQAAIHLLESESQRTQVTARMAQRPIRNELEEASVALARLIA